MNTDLTLSKALAFRRAASVLKSMTSLVTCMRQVQHKSHIGKHALRIIEVNNITGIDWVICNYENIAYHLSLTINRTLFNGNFRLIRYTQENS